MPTNPNKLSQFWQELKRRKVVRVITVYAATAFIIMEAGDIMLPRLGLPDWTVTFIIILLIIGFPISIILSWIFDLTPEGVVKTESVKITKQKETPTMLQKRKPGVSDVIIAVLVVVVGILVYPKIFNKDKLENIKDADGRISIAVMPFENQTGDTTLNWFQRGISSLIINGLGNSSELAVRDDHTMYEVMENMDQVFTAGISPSLSKEVAKKAHAETFVSGSYQGRDGTYRILANLVETESGDIIWTNKIEGDLKSSEYLDLADSLCNDIKNYLEIKVLEQEADYDFRSAYTFSAEAYRYYIEGMNLILTKDYDPAIQLLEKALKIDSTFALASFFIGYSYNYSVQNRQAKVWIQKAYNTKERLPLKYQYLLETWYAIFVSKNPRDMIKYCNLLEESGLESRLLWYDLATTYSGFLQQYEKAINAFEKVEEISLERGDHWEYEYFYDEYGKALHKAGKHEKENEIFELGLRLFPNNINKRDILWRQSICALSRKDTMEANEYIEKFISVKKEIGASLINIEHQMGNIHFYANMFVEAEEHYRKAYEMNPQKNKGSLHQASRMLIYGDINIDEGMKIIQKLSEQYPNSINVMWTKGWGYYKLGRYEESLQQLRRVEEESVYFYYDLHQQIKEVEQALAKENSDR